MNEDAEYPIADWQYQVANGDTRRGYTEWAEAEREANARNDKRKERQKNPIKMVCSACGSDRVLKDAYAEWDTDEQGWRLLSLFDANVCEDCGGETKLREEPMIKSEEGNPSVETNPFERAIADRLNEGDVPVFLDR
jgi:hypothetical protein